MKPDQAKIQELLKSFFDKQPAVKIAILFGSGARGRLTKGSDIDLAIAANSQINIEERADMANEISSLIKMEVDLIDLTQVSGLVLNEAMTKGILLKKNDETLFAQLMRKLWYNQADMAPITNYILEQRRRRFLDG